MLVKKDDEAIACLAKSWFIGCTLFGEGVCGMGVFVFRFTKMELGWMVELLDRNKPEGEVTGWLNQWVFGVAGSQEFHCCVGTYSCRVVLGVVGLVCVVGVLGV